MADAVPLLEVRDLRTHFTTRRGVAKAVDGVSFTLRSGETLGLIGESGSGKSVTCLSIARLVPQPSGRIVAGEVLLEGEDLVKKSESEMQRIRGSRIAYIMQDPLASLDPLFRVSSQVAEPMRAHHRVTRRTVRQRVIDILRSVRIPAPETRSRQFPHEMSGGMRQRVVAAVALGCEPQLLIADEPTTALDVTVQAQLLKVLRDVQRELNLGMIVVTHDFGIVARVCDRVAVMYAGRVVEIADVLAILSRPVHPYTRGLIASVPAVGERYARMPSIEGQPPDVRNIPAGCPFAPRCTYREERCSVEYPPAYAVSPRHAVHCWAAERILGRSPTPVAASGGDGSSDDG